MSQKIIFAFIIVCEKNPLYGNIVKEIHKALHSVEKDKKIITISQYSGIV